MELLATTRSAFLSARGRISAPMRQTTPIKIDGPHRYREQALVISREGAQAR